MRVIVLPMRFTPSAGTSPLHQTYNVQCANTTPHFLALLPLSSHWKYNVVSSEYWRTAEGSSSGLHHLVGSFSRQIYNILWNVHPTLVTQCPPSCIMHACMTILLICNRSTGMSKTGNWNFLMHFVLLVVRTVIISRMHNPSDKTMYVHAGVLPRMKQMQTAFKSC